MSEQAEMVGKLLHSLMMALKTAAPKERRSTHKLLFGGYCPNCFKDVEHCECGKKEAT